MDRIPPARPAPIAGLVLAGGLSSRFGADKALQRLGGVTLLERALATLREVCEAVAVSARDGEVSARAQSLGYVVLKDDPTHAKGPLGGIAAGLAWAQAAGFAHLVSLPCDTPLVDAAVLRTLIGHGPGGAYAVSADGQHPLIAVWPTAAARGLAERLAAGDHPAVRGFLAEIGVEAMRFADAGRFRNANTPTDLAAIAKVLGTGL